jgi:hypothetical protein
LLGSSAFFFCELANKARNGFIYNLPEIIEMEYFTNDIPSNIVLNGGE